ncbi:hypothetical protein Plec18170_008923 [Paecilomyces lecythidis]
MCTEFGAITGIFAADERTVAFLERRRVKKHKSSPIYFQPDEDATYAESFEIDLSKAQSWIALYPSPDNVVPVSEVSGMVLDGCFIGACTTAEEDLILGALVLSAGLRQGQTPVNRGRRVVVPGSRPIQHKLEKLGLLEFYRRAGFKIGVPGCSMCIGQGVDQAAPGEKWLSSQNRNFKNRMGPGSIGNLASAATVAASSFAMKICDPQELLDMIDRALLEQYLEYQPFDTAPLVNRPEVHYSEPHGANSPSDLQRAIDNTSENTEIELGKSSTNDSSHNITNGKILRLGDFIDTDANYLTSKEILNSLSEDRVRPLDPDEPFHAIRPSHGFLLGTAPPDPVLEDPATPTTKPTSPVITPDDPFTEMGPPQTPTTSRFITTGKDRSGAQR